MGRTISPPPGSIKSVQRGTVSAGSGATISAVNVNKSELRFLGCASNLNNPMNAHVTLTNSTTVSANVGSLTGTPIVSWELTEFY